MPAHRQPHHYRALPLIKSCPGHAQRLVRHQSRTTCSIAPARSVSGRLSYYSRPWRLNRNQRAAIASTPWRPLSIASKLLDTSHESSQDIQYVSTNLRYWRCMTSWAPNYFFHQCCSPSATHWGRTKVKTHATARITMMYVPSS